RERNHVQLHGQGRGRRRQRQPPLELHIGYPPLTAALAAGANFAAARRFGPEELSGDLDGAAERHHVDELGDAVVAEADAAVADVPADARRVGRAVDADGAVTSAE